MDVRTRLKVVANHLQLADKEIDAVGVQLFKTTQENKSLRILCGMRAEEIKHLRELVALQQTPETLGKMLKQKVLLDALGIKPDMMPYPTQKPSVALPKTESEANGHSAQHHGLQKHSVGDIYPWAIVGIGNGAVVHYELHNLVTDERVCRKVAGEDVVLGFRCTHSYVNAKDCLQAVLERGMDVSLGAYIAKPARRTSAAAKNVPGALIRRKPKREEAGSTPVNKPRSHRVNGTLSILVNRR